MQQEIVIVEDDADILDVLVQTLRADGYLPIAFRDADKALEHALRRPPALIVTDIIMPGMSGEQLVRRVRETCGPHLPILVVSASSSRSAIAQLPIQGYIGKPFDIGELLAAVRCCMGDANTTPAAPDSVATLAAGRAS